MPEREVATRLGVERYGWAADRIEPGLLVADAACGYGYGTEILYSREIPVVGFDVSREAMFAKRKWCVPFVVCNVELQTFSGFDCVVCLEALSHFIDPYAWLKNLDVPHLIVSMPTIPSKHIYPWRKHEIPEAELREWLTPKWEIKDEFRQARYLTLYGARP